MSNTATPALTVDVLIERVRRDPREFFSADVIAWAHSLDAAGRIEVRTSLLVAADSMVIADWWTEVERQRPAPPKERRASNPLLVEALSYARRGWAVFPIHTPTGSGCSCRAEECGDIGKHPRTRNGLKDATTDPARIERWWKQWPDANVGICTGPVGGGGNLVAIDIDPGRDGAENLEALEKTNSPLPTSIESITGGMGRHILTLSTTPIPNSVNSVARGIDVRGTGGYIVAPPSLHRSGRRYCWEGAHHPDETPLALLPQWFASLAVRRTSPSAASTGGMPDKVIQGARNETLFRVACSMRRKGLSEEAILAALLAENGIRCAPPLDDVEVQKIAHSAGKYTPSDPAAPAGATPADEDDLGDFQERLARGPRRKDGPGALLPIVQNAVTILGHDPEWAGVLAYNELRQETIALKPPPWHADDAPAGGSRTGPWSDEDDTRAANWLGRTWGLRLQTAKVSEAVRLVSRRRAHHPIREYLSSIEWDGRPRIDRWLSTYLGAPADEYTASVGRWWLISAVARIMRPGCKADCVLILEGNQGAGKSSALGVLAGDWFTDTPFVLGDKDSFLALRGRWVVELAELDSLMRADNARAKAFFSSPTDSYRPPYGRSVIDVARQCVFAGTVNPGAIGYLSDDTGGRRWWPVKVQAACLAPLAADRDQLWAEAAAALQGGGAWWPSADATPMLEEQQDARYASDAWEPVIAAWLEGESAQRLVNANGHITSGDVLTGALKLDVAKWDKSSQTRAGKCIGRVGWRRVRVQINGSRPWVYQPQLQKAQP